MHLYIPVLSILQSIHPPIHPFAHPSTHPSIHISTKPSRIREVPNPLHCSSSATRFLPLCLFHCQRTNQLGGFGQVLTVSYKHVRRRNTLNWAASKIYMEPQPLIQYLTRSPLLAVHLELIGAEADDFIPARSHSYGANLIYIAPLLSLGSIGPAVDKKRSRHWYDGWSSCAFRLYNVILYNVN